MAAKLVLFFHSLLEDLGIPQHYATIIYEDNKGALMMVNSQQPTRRTRHLEIKHFALLDWVERNLIILKQYQLATMQQMHLQNHYPNNYSIIITIYLWDN
jgi:hypothetical protein